MLDFNCKILVLGAAKSAYQAAIYYDDPRPMMRVDKGGTPSLLGDGSCFE